MAAIIRRSLDVALDADAGDRGRLWERAAAVGGSHWARDSGQSVARHHDEALLAINRGGRGSDSTR